VSSGTLNPSIPYHCPGQERVVSVATETPPLESLASGKHSSLSQQVTRVVYHWEGNAATALHWNTNYTDNIYYSTICHRVSVDEKMLHLTSQLRRHYRDHINRHCHCGGWTCPAACRIACAC